jgi:hypothetical protein
MQRREQQRGGHGAGQGTGDRLHAKTPGSMGIAKRTDFDRTRARSFKS